MSLLDDTLDTTAPWAPAIALAAPAAPPSRSAGGEDRTIRSPDRITPETHPHYFNDPA